MTVTAPQHPFGRKRTRAPLQRRTSFQTRKGRSLNLHVELSENRFQFRSRRVGTAAYSAARSDPTCGNSIGLRSFQTTPILEQVPDSLCPATGADKLTIRCTGFCAMRQAQPKCVWPYARWVSLVHPDSLILKLYRRRPRLRMAECQGSPAGPCLVRCWRPGYR